MPLPGTPESAIAAEERDDFRVSRARFPGERLNEAPGNRSQPAPWMAERDFSAAHDLIAIGTTTQENASQKI